MESVTLFWLNEIFIENNRLMKKRKILEYFEGTPDNVYDTESRITWHWNDGKGTCFGYFPASLDKDYEFLVGDGGNHMGLAEEAAKKKRQAEIAAKKRAEEAAAKKRAEEAAKRKAEEERRRREAEKPTKHVVKEGDNLTRLAARNGISVEDIKKANGINDDNIRIGETILIPKKGANGKVIIPQQPAKQQHQQSAKQQHQQSAKQQHQQPAKQQHQQPAKSKEKAKTNDTVQPKKRRR